ncbi:MAG: D-isomer specific 2-hydroxyacid dehydrogenase family protein [Olsenella sp.]|jgi:D-lactate dehydrogenase|nr:D-isomer specific 2-hydroxyacid dehydrogenase family protein [Olsenella sp.]
MRLFAYALREYDELGYMKEAASQLGFEFDWTSEYPTLDNASLAAGHDALCIITNPMPADLLDAFHAVGVKNLATRTIGYEHIDVAHARELGMRVANAPYPPEGVANYAIMLLLMAQRKVKLLARHSIAQDFGLHGKLGKDVSTSTVGVIGTGRIGSTVVRHLSGFGCRILAYDPYPNKEVEKYATYVDLDTLLAQADAITLHAPGLAENYHMLDSAAFAKMKDGVVLVNAARGMLVDTEALVAAVESGKVGAAALDTIENEADLYYRDLSRDVLPNRDRSVLMAFPNVIVSPHMAFYTAEDVRAMIFNSASALLAFSRGEDTPFEVRA